MLVELAALSDARPRNLYLLGLFVADHQLPECDALPAAPEATALPEPLEAAAVSAVPVPAQLSAPTSSVGAVPAGAAAVTLPESHEKPAAVSTAVPTAQRASARPTVAPVRLAQDGAAVDGAGAGLLTYQPTDTSVAAAVVAQPTSAAAAQPAGGILEPLAAWLEPLPGPPASAGARPLFADSKPHVARSAAPAPAATPHAKSTAAARPAQVASLAGSPERSSPEGVTALASPDQMNANATNRQMTRWGAEAASPLQPKQHWTGRLVNNATTDAAGFSVRPAQHGALSALKAAAAHAPAPARLQTEVVPAAGMPAQPADGRAEAAGPCGRAVPPEGRGIKQIPAAATAADETRQAAVGTAPGSEGTPGCAAAQMPVMASVCSARDAAAAKAATVRRPAAASQRTEPTLEELSRRSEPHRAPRNSRSHDNSRRRRSSDQRPDELRQRSSELRKDEARRRRSPGRSRDRSSTRRRETEERPGERKRPRSGSCSSDHEKRRCGRDSGGYSRERGRRRDDSRDRQVLRGPGPSDKGHSSDRWEGPGVAPAASMASMLMLNTEPEERASLLASVLGQVQENVKQRPAPHTAVSEEGNDGDLLPLPDGPLLSQGTAAQAEGDGPDVASVPATSQSLAAEAASYAEDMVREATEGARTLAAEDVSAQHPLPPDAVAAAGMRHAPAPAADAAAFLDSLSGLHAPVMRCVSAQSGDAGIHGQPVRANETHHPAELGGDRCRGRWDMDELPARQYDGGQVKRQRTSCHSDAADGTPAADGSSVARRGGVPAEWRHLELQPSYDMFSQQSQSPPPQPAPQPASGEPRPPSESPPPLPVDGLPGGMPPPACHLPPPPGQHTAWCAVKV